MTTQPTMQHIFDKTFKRIFALSDLAIVNLINGLFNKDHPLDAEVILTRNEFTSRTLTSRIADIFVQIDRRFRYHLEAKIQGEEDIVLRVFEYNFLDALQNRPDNSMDLHFAEPMVIYLNNSKRIPETSVINLYFGNRPPVPYSVKNFVLLKHEIEELNRKKMVLLIPFYMLKLRDELKTEKEPNLDALQHLIKHDILGSIEANLKFGNISQNDYDELISLTGELGEYLYSEYFKKAGEDMGRLFPDALMLPGDDLRYEIQTLKDEVAEKNAVIAENAAKIAALEAELAKLRQN